MKDNRQVYSVSQVNMYIKNMFIRETVLNNIYIKGEVSNCKYHSSGHIYFTLKDPKGQMACVMFAGQRSGLSFRMQEGQSVIVLGSISVYERDGKYQLYAREILQEGSGALYEKYEQLKRQLEGEGLFSLEHKKAIPFYSKRIGIVTAATGAAIQDICNIAARRNPYVQLVLYPARVQGDGAAATIVKGIKELDKMDVDVIIVGRGGGSIEDLWAFNEESVARAIYECKTPIVSAVGHETDTTIADYVSDLRAPTPSAAAELTVCSVEDLMEQFVVFHGQLNRLMKQKISFARHRLEKYQLKLRYKNPEYQIREKRQQLLNSEEQLKLLMEQKISKKRHVLELYIEKMRGLSPLNKLKGGYGFVADEEGRAIRSVSKVNTGDRIKVSVTDGEMEAVVERVISLTEKERKGKGK